MWPDFHSRLITVISDRLMERIAPAFLVRIEQHAEAIRERYLEIYDARSREVVTTIEILSPFNKAAGSQGHAAFLRKRQAVLSSQIHWIEIDLLRGGVRPPEVAGQSNYYTLLRRGDSDGQFEVWYTNLRDRLPTIAVPLRRPYADTPLDLQVTVDIVYTRAYYAASVDYTAPVPPPHLKRADATWAAAQVQAWQARHSTGTGRWQ